MRAKHTRLLTIKITLLAAVLGAMLVLVGILAPSQISAVSGADFTAGNIIDDAIFFNKNSMNTESIQNFLNSKVPVCNTNHAYSGNANDSGAPYICLKDYRQNTTSIAPESGLCNGYPGANNESAAQIIYKTAQSCGINPQVILVMLQKEQGLITDTWPWDIQYRKAMGAFCPDTAPCNPTYAGFFYQVYYGAHRFKVYAANPNKYNYKAGRNNYILYNPNAACGGSTVYIENQATANLYIYTPYQPNPATLSVGLGVTAPCGAYGNKNFWWYFTSWFGSTRSAKLIRTVSNNTVYYYDGVRKIRLSSMELAAQFGQSMNSIRFVSDQEMAAIPLAEEPYSTDLGFIVKSPDDGDDDGGRVYVVSNGYRTPVDSFETFTSTGLGTLPLTYLPLEMIYQLPLSNKSLSPFVQGPDLSVYKLEDRDLRPVYELAKLNQVNTVGHVSPLSWFTLNHWTPALPIVDGLYSIVGPDSSVRLYNNQEGKYQHIASMEVYDCLGLPFIKSFRLNTLSRIGGSSNGVVTRCLVKDSNDNAYIMNRTHKYLLSSSANITPIKVPDVIPNSVAFATLKPVIKSATSDELSILENHTKRPLTNMGTFAKLGFSGSSISTIPSSAYHAFPYGPKKFAIGDLIHDNSGGVSVISSNNSRIRITSAQLFEHYGYDWNSILWSNTSDLAFYAPQNALEPYVLGGSTAFLIDNGYRYVIPNDLDTAVGINRANLPSIDMALLSRVHQGQMTKFIKSTNDSRVYMLDGGKKRLLTSWTVFLRESSNRPQDITNLSPEAVRRFPNGSSVN